MSKLIDTSPHSSGATFMAGNSYIGKSDDHASFEIDQIMDAQFDDHSGKIVVYGDSVLREKIVALLNSHSETETANKDQELAQAKASVTSQFSCFGLKLIELGNAMCNPETPIEDLAELAEEAGITLEISLSTRSYQ